MEHDYELVYIEGEEGTYDPTSLKKFIASLRDFIDTNEGIQLPDDIEDVIKMFEYIGGNTGKHLKFWKERMKLYGDITNKPALCKILQTDSGFKTTCVCTHVIEYKYYIKIKGQNTRRYVVGSNCINNFGVRCKCKTCGIIYISRIGNQDNFDNCKECRKSLCPCGVRFLSKTYDRCKKCRFKCIKCNTKIPSGKFCRICAIEILHPLLIKLRHTCIKCHNYAPNKNKYCKICARSILKPLLVKLIYPCKKHGECFKLGINNCKYKCSLRTCKTCKEEYPKCDMEKTLEYCKKCYYINCKVCKQQTSIYNRLCHSCDTYLYTENNRRITSGKKYLDKTFEYVYKDGGRWYAEEVLRPLLAENKLSFNFRHYLKYYDYRQKYNL